MLRQISNMKVVRNLVMLLMVTVIVSLSAVGQQKDQKKKSDPQGPIQVRANVMVIDSKTELVNDIKLEDLKVFEDGVEQKLTSFARKEPVALALVVDNSGSLRSQLGTIISAAKLAVFNLDTDDEAMVIRFVNSNAIQIIQEWTSDKAKMLDAVENMYVEGGASAVMDALVLTVEKVKEKEKVAPSKKYAVLFISDCEDVDSYFNVAQLIRTIGDSEMQIFPFAMMSEINLKTSKSARTLAATLSLRTGGNFYTLEKKFTKDQLLANMKAFFIELRSQYVIGYTSSNLTRDSTRQLRVEVRDGATGEKRRGLIREGYYVPEKY